jgi:hypothetical protein
LEPPPLSLELPQAARTSEEAATATAAVTSRRGRELDTSNDMVVSPF